MSVSVHVQWKLISSKCLLYVRVTPDEASQYQKIMDKAETVVFYIQMLLQAFCYTMATLPAFKQCWFKLKHFAYL